MATFTEWTTADAADFIKRPEASDDKYSRGVLGVITGSDEYPGAAVLGVEAALRTGLGMVRFLGPHRPATMVLARRPEAVVSDGRVQAWLIGSGTDHASYSDSRAEWAIKEGHPTVLDGGALGLHDLARGPLVLTPHFGELARLLPVENEDVAADPAGWAARANLELGHTVLLKGNTTYIAGEDEFLSVMQAPAWLATAGAGDALAGILGALLATHASEIRSDPGMLPRLAATAAVIHGLAAYRASAGGPFTILDLCAAIPATIADLLRA